MDKKFYDGLCGIIEANAGYMPSQTEGYMDMKTKFRYPGEVLERMEEQGYSSEGCYQAALNALTVKKALKALDADKMFVGSQLQDFIRTCEIFAANSESFPVYAGLYAYTGEEKYLEKAKEVLCKMDDLEAFEALGALAEMGISRIYAFLDGCVGLPARMHMIKPAEHLEEYAEFIRAGHLLKTGEYGIGKAWLDFLTALAPLYDTHVKEDTPKARKLQAYGYTYKDILDMNFYMLRDEKFNSPVKYFRMAREWVHATLCSQEPASEKEFEVMRELASDKLPRKIDGTNDAVRMMFLSCTEPITDPDNAAFMAETCFGKGDDLLPDYLLPCFSTFSLDNASFVREVQSRMQGKEDLPVWTALYQGWNSTCRKDGKNTEVFISKVDAFGKALGTDMHSWIITEIAPCYSPDFYAVFYSRKFADIQEALENGRRPAKQAAAAYISGFGDRAAYDALVGFWERTRDNEEIPSYAKNLIPHFVLHGEEPPFGLGTEELRNVLYISLCIMFRASGYRKNSYSLRKNGPENYEDLLFVILKSDALRKAFSTEEARSIYEMVRANSGSHKWEVESLKPYFLSEKEIREEKAKEEAARKEQERAKQAEEVRAATADLFEKAGEIAGRELRIGETIPLYVLLKAVPEKYCFSRHTVEVWIQELAKSLPNNEKTEFGKKEYVNIMDRLLYFYGKSVLSRDTMRAVDSRISVIEEAD